MNTSAARSIVRTEIPAAERSTEGTILRDGGEATEILTAAMAILSTKLRWYERDGKQISPAWKVEFEDDYIRSHEAGPASARTDAHTGEELLLSYYFD